MHFSTLTNLKNRKKADVLVIPYRKKKRGIEIAGLLDSELARLLAPVLETKDFCAKIGDLIFHYVEGFPERRIALLGLGSADECTKETLRRSYGALTKRFRSKRIESINLLIPEGMPLDESDLIESIAEGLLLPNYVFLRHKHPDPDEPDNVLLQKVTWIGRDKKILRYAEKIAKICEGVDYARHLVNGNADEITPQYLTRCAHEIAQESSQVHATVFDKKRIEKEQMGLLSAVSRGSFVDPAFIILEYRGNSGSEDRTIVVGKGVTYDTGGLNLKPTGGIETMKCDMAGGAACLGMIVALARLALPVNVTAVIPCTENGIDARSFKPGDVYTGYSGKTVEMTNSDAEGRLILADALAYACKKLKPTRLIDIATLTGAIEVALGAEASGLMCTNEGLAFGLIRAGESTFERVWRMPLYAEYKSKLKSDIADIKSWNGRSGSSSVAAIFLSQFVDESIPWAHLDIAGTAFISEEGRYLPKYATGVGVRLLIEFLAGLSVDEKR